MANLLSILLTTVAVFVLVPVAVFLAEVIAAIALPRKRFAAPNGGTRGRIAVLMPAHNESVGLQPTLSDIRAQLEAGDRIVVVADNCTDDTAAVAREAGAEVLSRSDPDRRGKGYALAFGVSRLALDPPDIVIIVDADCRLSDTTIERLASACMESRRPVQALYLMNPPSGSALNYRVATFAWRVKNLVRPLGLGALGFPCQLTGTGMAFSWEAIRSVDLASGSIVEDLKLGLDLALAGKPPVFCPDAVVTSDFPFSVEGIETQRRRWEHGHIGMIVTMLPRLISAAVRQPNLPLLALALDLAVPPLSLLGFLVVGMFMVAGIATLFGISSAALFVSSAGLLGFAGGVFLAWLRCGRDILPPGAILSIGPYVIGKLPLYGRMLSRSSNRTWIRTDRRKM